MDSGFSDHHTGNNVEEHQEDDQLVAGDFDYTEVVESPFSENQYENYVGDTEELDIPNFVGDLRALMVEDSEDELVVSDSDDDMIAEPKLRKTRGTLWRRVSVVGSQSTEVRSSAGSNLTDKVTDNGPTYAHADTKLQEVPAEISAQVDHDAKSSRDTKNSKQNEPVDESQEPTERSREMSRFLNNENDQGAESSKQKEPVDEFQDAENTAKVDQDTNSLKGDEIVYESQTPGELSQATALNFVDQYLSVSCVNSSPEVKIPKVDGMRSPLASCAKGSHDMAKKANLMTKIGISTFDFIDSQSEHNGEPFLKKQKELDNEDAHGISTFDVGFETQMAAEAMESLIFAAPPSIDADEKFSFPSRANCNSRAGGMSLKQKRVTNQNYKELNTELLSTKTATKRGSSNEKCKKVFTRKKQKKDSEKETIQGGYRKHYSLRQRHQNVKTFSPVASRTRHGSSVKQSRNAEDACKQVDFIHKRKTSDLDTVLETTSDHLEFNTWNWPKKKRTRLNTRLNAKVNSEALFMSSVKRKARSASKYRPTACKSGQPTLSASISLPDEPKMKDSLSEGKTKKQPMKKNSTSPSLKNELTRLGYAESSPDFISKYSRRRIRKTEIRVMFSQNLDEDVVKQQKKIMKLLGTCMAKDCSDATHFVADRFARTKKMLQAMALGKLVVTPLWLESCEQAMCIIDEKNYILRDEKKEKEIGFNMSVSLSHARSHPLLKDRRVLITANVEPDKEMIVNLVKAVHGQVIEGIQKADLEYNVFDDLLILSCKQDYAACVPLLDKGAAVYSSELLLNGIIAQKLEYARHQLFGDHVKMIRYARQRKKNGNQRLLGC